jgi:segregation and condensation protein A
MSTTESNGNLPIVAAEAATWDEDLIGGGAPPIRLPVFEGPLDLLLFLIRKNEIDIYDIPIERITSQYLGIIRAMEKLELEIVGDFLVMAATLMEIKSRLLLPRPNIAEEDADEEGQDPRWELVSQLLEYRQFKEAANELEASYMEQQSYYPRIIRNRDTLTEPRALRNIDRVELWDMFNQVLKRLADSITVGEIQDEQFTVSDRMGFILQILPEKKRFLFSDLFAGTRPNITIVVASFLAILELTRLNRLQISQDEEFGDILCSAVETEIHESPHTTTANTEE